MMTERRIFPLSRLTMAVEKVVRENCSNRVWVKAEIVKLNRYVQKGHCFPDLVEKRNGRIVAEIRGNIWKTNFEMISRKFREVLNEDLKDDMTVVIEGMITYHSIHGLALNILDIDPEYTLGELARQKTETIKKLKREGIFEANKQTNLPQLPKTLAVISADNSKGYQDFMSVIGQNIWNFKFHTQLFPAILQGENAVMTISEQLHRIRKHTDLFDAVLIIRGGGGEVGLSCYDNYNLAKEISTFPLPVLTGIGHSTNETVSELVSHRNFITPTKVGEFLLQEFWSFSAPLQEGVEKIRNAANLLFERQGEYLSESSRIFGFLTRRVLERNSNRLQHCNSAILAESKTILQHEKAELRNMFTSVKLLSPQNILKRGYSITRKDGKIISKTADLQAGDLLTTELSSGKVNSRIVSFPQKEEEHGTENELF